MKVTSVELHPAGSSNVAVLSFRDPTRQNAYNVKQITGLDAEEIVPRFYAGSDSSTDFYNLTLARRVIIVRVGLNPDYSEDQSHSTLRDDLYKLIGSSRTGLVEIQFKNGEDVTAVISGFVTKLEAPLFEKESEVHITIRCDEPILKAPERTELDPEVDLVDFPLVINNALSTAPHGFVFTMTFLYDVESLVLKDPTDESWNFTVTPLDGFLEGDVLWCSSEHNYKYLHIVRDEDIIHLVDVIQPGSVWPLLFPGLNTIQWEGFEDQMSWDSLSYFSTYWGV